VDFSEVLYNMKYFCYGVCKMKAGIWAARTIVTANSRNGTEACPEPPRRGFSELARSRAKYREG
jgi:hypothetical protein